MTAKRARYAKIEKLIDGILDEAGIYEPAVDVRRLVNERGIEIRKGDIGPVSGLIARRGTRSIIGVNSTQTSSRQRFTVAHEFGHFLLHEGIFSHTDNNFRLNYRDDKSSQAVDVDEIEANFFAACLLMPKKFLDQEKASDHIDDDKEVGEIAKRFDVSQHAMSLRLANVYRRYRPF